jgi:hypothetical protein
MSHLSPDCGETESRERDPARTGNVELKNKEAIFSTRSSTHPHTKRTRDRHTEADVDFVDACGLGGPLQVDAPPPPHDRQYPGHHGVTCRQRDFEVETWVARAESADQPHAPWDATSSTFQAELRRLIATDERAFADTDMVLTPWLLGLQASPRPVQAAHI